VGSPGLEGFQAELFEEAAVLGDREAPFGVVVGEVFGRGGAPMAAWAAVEAGDR